VGLPLQYFFGFHLNFGVIGLWYAQTFGAVTQMLWLLWVLYKREDWEEVARKIARRVEKDS